MKMKRISIRIKNYLILLNKTKELFHTEKYKQHHK